MTHTQTIYIVDVSSYIFRAYYAIRTLSTSSGLPTNAVYGFTQMILKLLKDKDPTHIILCFDSREPSFRKKEYEAYKANREVPPDDLVPQFEYIHKVVQALNLPVLQMKGFEADDIIATLVKKIVPKDFKIQIVTGDKDLMQLVDKRVHLLDEMKEKEIDEHGVKEKFGVRPDQVLEVLGLMGDSSDNIPGVPGIGPKTASALIQQFGSMDNLYEHLDELKGKRKDDLIKFKDQAYLSKKLASLSAEVPISTTLEDFERKGFNEEECRRLFEELEFFNLLKQFGGMEKKLCSDNYTLIVQKDAYQKFLERLQNASCFAFDTEATSLNFTKAKLVGLAFAFTSSEAFYLPLGHQTKEPQLDLKEVLADLRPYFENPKIKKYAQNFKYDAHVLKNHGIEIRGLVCDTMIAAYLLDPASSHQLDFLSGKYLQYRMTPFDEVNQRIVKDEFALVTLQDASAYGCEDADVTLQLSEQFLKIIPEQNLEKVFSEIEIPLTEVLLKMERKGVKVDLTFLHHLQKDFGERLKKKEEEIYRLAGETFNIQSPKQLGQLLFEKLKLPTIRKTKTGYSTDVDVLTELAKIHDLPKEILDFRGLAKLKSTYVDALLELADPKTHRIHTSFNQTVAETGRLSSSDPNLQNIPIRSEDGAKIRRAFVADAGYELISADYSQIELRILAYLSEDPVLLEAFQKDEDIHRITAASIFQVSEQFLTPAMRSSGKTVNFAVIYGQSPFGLSQQLGVTQQVAKKYIENYFEKYRGVKKYREEVLARARQQKEVRTLMGRRRFVPDIDSKNTIARNFAERIAFNTIVQGSAADLIKKAMIEIDHEMTQRKMESFMVLQVHDELVFEAKQSEVKPLRDLIREKMENVLVGKVPLHVEIGEGKNWGEAHE